MDAHCKSTMDEEDEDTSGYCSQSYTSMPLNKSSINWHNQNYMVRIKFLDPVRLPQRDTLEV